MKTKTNEEKLEELKQYLSSQAPLNNLEEFTMSAMNGILADSNIDNRDPIEISRIAAETAMATLTKLYEIQNS